LNIFIKFKTSKFVVSVHSAFYLDPNPSPEGDGLILLIIFLIPPFLSGEGGRGMR
jgi:hypothetical protein